MSYREPITSVSDLFMVSEEVETKVQEALDKGKKVEYENSSFADTGDDWSKILIDGISVHFSTGY